MSSFLTRCTRFAGPLLCGAALPLGAQSMPKLASEKYVLPNGLQVILYPDQTVPIVAVNTWFYVGSGNEQAGKTGLAHLFEHLTSTGSQHVPVGQFVQRLEAAGASESSSTSEDRTSYFEMIPSTALGLAVWLESDRMGYFLPALDQARFNVQRAIVENERRQTIEDVPYGRAQETILAALYPSQHPYSHSVIGPTTDLSSVSFDDAKAFFSTYYVPNNATLVLAGAFNDDAARTLIANYFANLPKGAALPAVSQPASVQLAKDVHTVLEDKVQLPRVYYAWPTVKAFDKDDAPLTTLASVLADGKNSRLYKRLVYDLQVAQDVSASQIGSKLAGMFQVAVTPREGQSPAKIDSLVREELARVQKDGITARELARAQNTKRASYLPLLTGVGSKAYLLNYYNYFAGTPDYLQQDVARYAAVTRDDVQRVAREYLGKPKVVLTVVPEGHKEMMVAEGGR